MGRRTSLALVVVLAVGAGWLMGGCTPQVGPTQEMSVDEPLTSAAVTDVNLFLGVGRLAVSPGAAGLVSGTVTYNVAEWRPKISRTDASVTIRQGSTEGPSGPESDIVNRWDLQLGPAPMRLKIEGGAYEGELDLSGLSLQRLDINDGAAQTQVVFSLPNPSQLELLRYQTAASTVSLRGLGNANLAAMEFDGAAGTYSLDFSGQPRSDATVELTVAAGTLRIEVPGTTRLEVRIRDTMAEVASEGPWTIDGTTYSTPALVSGADGKTITVLLQMSAGSATLVCK
jgi:hypothetical protein